MSLLYPAFMKQIELAGMRATMAGGTDHEGGGDGPLVVLLHGFGAAGDDLLPLWRMIDAPPATRWAFPAAPLVLQAVPVEARAWWMVDIERFMLMGERGEFEACARENPRGLDLARERLAAWLLALMARMRPSRLVLGGFSQGAMLACDLAVRTDLALAGVIALSGSVVASDQWAAAPDARRGLPVFLSHGRTDPLLPFEYAQKLRDLLSARGMDVTWRPFEGGHQVPDQALQGLGPWLRDVLKP